MSELEIHFKQMNHSDIERFLTCFGFLIITHTPSFKISIKELTDLHFREEIKSPVVQNTDSDFELNLDSGAYACY